MAATIRVSVVEDIGETREVLRALLDDAPGFDARFECVGAHGTGEEALLRIPQAKPHVVLLDLQLPDLSGLECLRRLRALLPGAEIVVFTISDQPEHIFEAIAAGATGYLLKPSSRTGILGAIAEAHSGGSPMSPAVARLVLHQFRRMAPIARRMTGAADAFHLTHREAEILELLSQGQSREEVAAELRIALRTVGSHLHHIYEKLRVHSQSQAVARYLCRDQQATAGMP